MRDYIQAAKAKLAEDWYLILGGAVIGSTLTAAAIYVKIHHDYDQLLTLPLGKEAFNALVNDETNFVYFGTGKHDHMFHVTLAQ